MLPPPAGRESCRWRCRAGARGPGGAAGPRGAGGAAGRGLMLLLRGLLPPLLPPPPPGLGLLLGLLRRGRFTRGAGRRLPPRPLRPSRSPRLPLPHRARTPSCRRPLPAPGEGGRTGGRDPRDPPAAAALSSAPVEIAYSGRPPLPPGSRCPRRRSATAAGRRRGGPRLLLLLLGCLAALHHPASAPGCFSRAAGPAGFRGWPRRGGGRAAAWRSPPVCARQHRAAAPRLQR